jgi:hypothetical protein
MKSVVVFLIVVAIIAGMVGCGPVKYNLTISSTEGGEVTIPGEGTFTYDEGTVVNLTAEADEGYQFFNWTGNVSTISDVNSTTTSITMNGHYLITANFAYGNFIQTWYDLDDVRDNLGDNYLLMNDLDSTTPGYDELASDVANQGEGWQPIGYRYWDDGRWVKKVFKGTFDGQGYEIRDLFIDRPTEYDVGLFGYVDEGGVIENVGMVNVDVTGEERIGGMVGFNDHGTVSNSYSTGSVTGVHKVGGLVGYNRFGTVSNSYSTGNVHGTADVGGLVGDNDRSTVSNSYSTGSVTGEDGVGGLMGLLRYGGTVFNAYSTGNVTGNTYVGGLVGRNSNSTVSDSYSTGNVHGTADVGGLLGWNMDGTVSNSYSTGSVTGDSYIGGLVGVNQWNSTVSDSYATGSVFGNEWVGGLVGQSNNSTVSNSFWDTETSGQATSDGGTGKNTTEMKDIATFLGAVWDIIAVANPSTRNPSYIWNIVDDETYPFLSWEPVP